MLAVGASFNSSMLILAREALALTQSELAPLARMSQGQLSRVEGGLLTPSEEAIDFLARACEVPKEFFFQPQQPIGPGVSEFFHRRRQDVSAKTLKQAHARITIILLHLKTLLRAAEIDDCRIPRLDIDEFKSVAEAARAVRAVWGLPAGPVQNLIGAIESAGAIVVRCDLASPRIDAISRWVPGLPPVFFLNKGMPADRERLSLAHELGHLVLHRSPVLEMESEANQFAGEFLMPASDIRHDFGRVNLHRLAVLKPYWRTSMAALLHRAADLEVVTERSARSLWMQLGKAGYKRREPPELDFPHEEPTLFHGLLDFHCNELGYGVEQLARLLCATPSFLASAYGLALPTRAQFRLVK